METCPVLETSPPTSVERTSVTPPELTTSPATVPESTETSPPAMTLPPTSASSRVAVVAAWTEPVTWLWENDPEAKVPSIPTLPVSDVVNRPGFSGGPVS